MHLIGDEPCPLPEDPSLAATAAALNGAGYWGEIVDQHWRGVYMTDDARWMFGARAEFAPYAVGAHFLGRDRVEHAMRWRGGQFPLDILRQAMTRFGPWILADTPGGRDALRELVDPRLADLVGDVTLVDPAAPPWFPFRGIYTAAGQGID